MTGRYYAMIHGNDVGASAKYEVGNTLDEAKTAADEQLGDGYRHHRIAIYDREGDEHEAIAVRELSSDEWLDNDN